MDLLTFNCTGELVFQRAWETTFVFWEKRWHSEKNCVCTQDRKTTTGSVVVVVK